MSPGGAGRKARGDPGDRGPDGRSKEGLAQDAWRLLLSYLLASRDRNAAIAAELGLTLGEMRALLSLDAERAKPMGVLAEEWRCDASNVTWLVDRLEERGIAERQPLPGDRRVKQVSVTPLGEKTRAELLRRIHQPPEEIAALSPSELSALVAALEKLSPPPSSAC